MGLPWEPTKGPKARKMAAARFKALAAQIGDDDLDFAGLKEIVPDEWFTLEMDIECREKKEKLTLYLSGSVARSFRAMGEGYQARINRILELWLQMQIAKPWHEEREIVEWAADAAEEMRRADYEEDEVDEYKIRLLEGLAREKGWDAGA